MREKLPNTRAQTKSLTREKRCEYYLILRNGKSGEKLQVVLELIEVGSDVKFALPILATFKESRRALHSRAVELVRKTLALDKERWMLLRGRLAERHDELVQGGLEPDLTERGDPQTQDEWFEKCEQLVDEEIGRLANETLNSEAYSSDTIVETENVETKTETFGERPTAGKGGILGHNDVLETDNVSELTDPQRLTVGTEENFGQDTVLEKNKTVKVAEDQTSRRTHQERLEAAFQDADLLLSPEQKRLDQLLTLLLDLVPTEATYPEIVAAGSQLVFPFLAEVAEWYWPHFEKKLWEKHDRYLEENGAQGKPADYLTMEQAKEFRDWVNAEVDRFGLAFLVDGKAYRFEVQEHVSDGDKKGFPRYRFSQTIKEDGKSKVRVGRTSQFFDKFLDGVSLVPKFGVGEWQGQVRQPGDSPKRAKE